MGRDDIRLLQRMLAEDWQEDPGPIDGLSGPRTLGAVRAALWGRSGLPDGWKDWPDRRQMVLALQYACWRQELEVGPLDGWWGPQTEYAVEQLQHLRAHGCPESPWRDHMAREPAAAKHWPRERDVAEQFGEPGSQLMMLDLPYPLYLAWDPDTRVSRTQCHRQVRDSLRQVLEDVLEQFGLDGIRELRLDWYGGGYNHRSKRGGSSLSMHAWGIAFDFLPQENKLRWGRDRARFARPEYEPWWACWERQGWVSLGRLRNFDWMHVQAARLD